LDPVNPDDRTVRDYMVPVPHAVDPEQSVADACAHMQALGVRHLPVIDAGRVVGLLSDREACWVGAVPNRDPQSVAVADVMALDPPTAAPDTPLHDVVRMMAERRADGCLIVEDGRVVGIFTATDGLQVLAALLSARGATGSGAARPSQIRARILAEHQVLASMYAEVEQLAAQVVDGDGDGDAGIALRASCRSLYRTLQRHIEIENAVLGPALRDTDAFGQQRADGLLREHERQQSVLAAALATLDAAAPLAIARDCRQLIRELRADMAEEERALLDADLLKDDVVAVGTSTG
jgi:acetoin utilization protein AcuB